MNHRDEHAAALAITPEQAQSAWYQRAMAQEIDASEALDDAQLADLRINRPEVLAYRGGVLGSDADAGGYAGWTEFLIEQYAPRRSCLSLGSGVGRVESYLLGRGFAGGFDAIELSPNANRAAGERDGRIGAVAGDLNFVTLPEDRYDFILCHGVLHHLINLEHVMHQIDRALTPDGILLVYEYVGEDRWQFTPERMARVRKAAPGARVRVPSPWEVSGFESVRSSDLLGVIGHQFEGACERSVGYGGVYFPFIVTTGAREDHALADVVAADAEASRSGAVTPCYHMGVYRKTGRDAAPARAWSDREVRERLCPDQPIVARAIDEVRRSALGPALRRAKRGVRASAARIGIGAGAGISAGGRG